MAEVLYSPSSSPSASISTPTHHNGALFLLGGAEEVEGFSRVTGVEFDETNIGGEVEEGERDVKERENKETRDHQLSLLALLVALFRKSFWMACKASNGTEELCGGATARGSVGGLEIGWPTNVRHVAHVTFDRFNGFLGLPVEFEPEVPRRAPSASTTVFGVSTESMQLSFDSRGNSVPTIILLMQKRLYAQGGLQAEGIFRINAENSQEEYVRDHLNRGIVPEDIDVHCLAGLIKAWFRELPRGVLDPLSPEQVTQCQSEDDCSSLARLLPPSEAALLDWAINLMADVVQLEHLNKMNARNIAMVFAPNMTQMSDPLTALMYAVQVMNFLKTLIEKILREREDNVVEVVSASHREASNGDGHQSPQLHLETVTEFAGDAESVLFKGEPDPDSASDSNQLYDISEEEYLSYSTSATESEESESCSTPTLPYIVTNDRETRLVNVARICSEQDSPAFVGRTGQSSDICVVDYPKKLDEKPNVNQAVGRNSKSKEISNLSRINSTTKRIEAWR